MPPWRNRLARSAVNRKVGGSSPPGGANLFRSSDSISNGSFLWGAVLPWPRLFPQWGNKIVFGGVDITEAKGPLSSVQWERGRFSNFNDTGILQKSSYDPGRIRTCNLLIRSQTRYPLRHWAIIHDYLWPQTSYPIS